MLLTTRNFLHCLCALTGLAIGNLAHAADTEGDSYVSHLRYVSLDAQTDNADSSRYSATGSFTLGRHTWLEGMVGKVVDDTSNGLGDLKNFGVGGGLKGKHLQFALNFDHYKNDADYRQRDVAAALDWYATRFSVGLDASHRKVDNTYGRGLISESLSGKGFGAHGSVNLTDRLSLSAGGMGYHYDQTLAVTTTLSPSQVQAQPQPIRQLIGQIQQRIDQRIQNAVTQRSGSVVTRSIVPLANSYNLGLNYYFDAASVYTQYVRDKLLDSNSTTNTISLGASLSLGDHWIVAPQVGHAASDASPDVTFGGLSVSYSW